MAATPDLNIKLAVYMERLYNYIESQATLNETIGRRLEKHGENLDALQNWQSRFFGARWITGGLGILIVHTTVILASIMGMVRWIK